VAGGLRIRHHGRPPGRYHGSVWLRSNGGELTFDVEIEVVGPTPAAQPPDSADDRVGPRPPGRRRLLVSGIALLLVAMIGVIGGLVTRSRSAETPLEELLADFTSKGFPQATSTRFTAESTSEYPEKQLTQLRELGLQRGLRWRAKHPRTGQELEVRIYEFQAEGPALRAQDLLSICPRNPTTFDTSRIATSKGRQCRVRKRQLGARVQVQEVTFTRGPRLFKLKLSETSPSASPPPDVIIDLAVTQAAVAH
jgi:hypothetical protein